MTREMHENEPSPLSTPRISQASHNLLSLPHALLQTSRTDNLQHRRHATKSRAVLRISISPSLFNQPSQLFQERLGRLDHPPHPHKFPSDNWILD